MFSHDYQFMLFLTSSRSKIAAVLGEPFHLWFVVVTQLLLDGWEFCKTFCIGLFVYLQRWFLTTFQNRTPGIRFFVWLSGFLKSVFLKSTYKTKFLGAKIFPDKKCPASGFCLNHFCAAFLYIGCCLVMF